MISYAQIKPYIDDGKTDAEIVAILNAPVVTRTPFWLTCNQINILLPFDQARAFATQLATLAAADPWFARLQDTLCGSGVDLSLDQSQALLDQFAQAGYFAPELCQMLKSLGVTTTVGNATESEVAWLRARGGVEAELDARYAALLKQYNAAKSALGSLAVGDEIPTAETLWA